MVNLFEIQVMKRNWPIVHKMLLYVESSKVDSNFYELVIYLKHS